MEYLFSQNHKIISSNNSQGYEGVSALNVRDWKITYLDSYLCVYAIFSVALVQLFPVQFFEK